MNNREIVEALRAIADDPGTAKGDMEVLYRIASSLEGQACEHDWAIGYGRPPYCNKCGTAQAEDKPS